jgi:hypothetical protein
MYRKLAIMSKRFFILLFNNASVKLSHFFIPRGRVVELVDTLVLGTSGASREGSSPSSPTIEMQRSGISLRLFFIVIVVCDFSIPGGKGKISIVLPRAAIAKQVEILGGPN